MRVWSCISGKQAKLCFRQGSLERFLKNEIGVEEGDILAYLADGRRLTNENTRDLAGVEDQVCGGPVSEENIRAQLVSTRQYTCLTKPIWTWTSTWCYASCEWRRHCNPQ